MKCKHGTYLRWLDKGMLGECMSKYISDVKKLQNTSRIK